MRTLNIPMSQAAKDRLSLLKNPDALLLPLDHEALRPFGFTFRNNIMCVTFEGTDVAFVPTRMAGDKHFGLTVMLSESATADAALKRFFVTLTHHLDAVGRHMREEKRREAGVLQAHLEEIKRANATQVARDEAALREFLVPADVELPVGHQITTMDCLRAFRFPHPDDAFACEFDAEFNDEGNMSPKSLPLFNILLSPNIHEEVDFDVYAQWGLEEAYQRLLDKGFKLNEPLITAEIIRLRDRTLAIEADNKVEAFINALPDGDYRIEIFAFRPRPEMNGFFREIAGITVKGAADGIQFYQNGCLIQTFAVAHFDRIEYPQTAQDGLRHIESYHRQENMMERAGAIGNFLITELARENPDLNFEIYKPVNVQALEAEALKVDTGYTF